MSNKKAKGKRAKTRCKMKHRGRQKTVNDRVRIFDRGKNVQIVIDSAIHRGMPDNKFHGLSGMVAGKRGICYEVNVNDGNLQRMIIVDAAHLRGKVEAKA